MNFQPYLKNSDINSRRNNDTIPEEIANLGDNTFARPDLNSDEYAETAKTIKRLENQIENSALMRKAKQDLEILYKAKSIIINRINYDDDDCSFLRLQCHNDRFNKCIEIIEDELY